jgi:hypothetical protein
MTAISDIIKQLEEKASKYDELITDLGKLLSKYNANSNPKEELVHVDEKWMEAFNKCQKWELEGRGENWAWKADLMKKYGEINHISNRGTLNNRFNKTAKIMFDHTKQGRKNFVRPRGYEPSKDTEVESETNNIGYERVESYKPMKKVDVLEDLIKGQTVDIKSKRGDLYDERLFKLISYYEIPLKLSKKIAQFSNWEYIAQGWCGAEAKGKLTKWVVDNSEVEPVVYAPDNYYYEFTCAKSSETRGRRRTVNTKGPCGKLNIHKTRRQITDKSKHQGRCKNCGNRVRLNSGNVRLLEGVD